MDHSNHAAKLHFTSFMPWALLECSVHHRCRSNSQRAVGLEPFMNRSHTLSRFNCFLPLAFFVLFFAPAAVVAAITVVMPTAPLASPQAPVVLPIVAPLEAVVPATPSSSSLPLSGEQEPLKSAVAPKANKPERWTVSWPMGAKEMCMAGVC